MGDLELLNSVVDISHWVETPISLHAAILTVTKLPFTIESLPLDTFLLYFLIVFCTVLAKDATTKVIVLQNRANVERQKFRVGANVTLDVCA
jgi:hypothetical protein